MTVVTYSTLKSLLQLITVEVESSYIRRCSNFPFTTTVTHGLLYTSAINLGLHEWPHTHKSASSLHRRVVLYLISWHLPSPCHRYFVYCSSITPCGERATCNANNSNKCQTLHTRDTGPRNRRVSGVPGTVHSLLHSDACGLSNKYYIHVVIVSRPTNRAIEHWPPSVHLSHTLPICSSYRRRLLPSGTNMPQNQRDA